jgi:hypothetical protein
MIEFAKALWDGRVPLKTAFWEWAIVYGLIVNLVTSGLFFGLVMYDAALLPLIVAFVLPVPFNLFVVVAVWRSADRYQGPKKWADLGRVATIVWMLVLTVVG